MAYITTDGINQNPSNKKYIVINVDHYNNNVDPHGVKLYFTDGVCVDQVFSGLILNTGYLRLLDTTLESGTQEANTVYVSENIRQYDNCVSFISGIFVGQVADFVSENTIDTITLTTVSGINTVTVNTPSVFTGNTEVYTGGGYIDEIDHVGISASMDDHIIAYNPHNDNAENVLGISKISGIVYGNISVLSGLTVDTVDLSETKQLINGSIVDQTVHSHYEAKYDLISPSYKNTFLSGIYASQDTYYENNKSISRVIGSGISTGFSYVVNQNIESVAPKNIKIDWKSYYDYNMSVIMNRTDLTYAKEFDEPTNTWGSNISLPASTYLSQGQGTTVNNISYLLCYNSGDSSVIQIAKYDVDLSSFSVIETGLTADSFSGYVSCFYDNYIYYFAYDTVYQFEPIGETLTVISTIPSGYQVNGGCCHIYKDKIYIVRGNNTSSLNGYIMEYDPINNTWGDIKTGEAYTQGAACYGREAEIFFLSSSNASDTKVTKVYNIDTDTWSERGNSGLLRFMSCATFYTNDDYIHVIGGLYTSLKHYAYNINSNTYSLIAPDIPVYMDYTCYAPIKTVVEEKNSKINLQLFDTTQYNVLNKDFDATNSWEQVNETITGGTWNINEKYSIKINCFSNSGVESLFSDILLTY